MLMFYMLPGYRKNGSRIPKEYLKIKGAYTIDSHLIKGSEAIVMHPLPRVDEISHDVDNSPYGRYFQQAFYGVPVRMALLKSIIK